MQAVIRLYREARRRKVFRTAALYVVGAWALLQAAALSFPGFGIPDAAIRAAIWAAVLGFPLALVFGWLFEIDGGGIRRTLPATAGEAAEPRPLVARDYILLAAFAVVALTLLYQAVRGVRETPVERAAVGDAVAPEAATRLANSIAVLPFANISDDPANEYFCDGISEEILNALSGFRELNVIGRTSSFAFKGSDAGVDRISAVLGVRHVLQGSVRKSGNQLRISAQLLDETGRQLWTQTFDRELANVFDIQSEIAAAVAAMVAPQIVAHEGVAPRPSLEAYERYLAGRELLHRREEAGALAEFQRAIELDPDFAEARVEWAIVRVMGEPSSEQLEAARQEIDRALASRPQLLRAQAARALWLLASRPADPAGAEATLRGVLAQDPNMSDALLWLANALGMQRRRDERFSVLQRAARVDPLHPSIAVSLADELFRRGDVEQGVRLLGRSLEQPSPPLRAFVALRDYYHRAGRLIELNAIAKAQALRGPPNHPYQSHYSLALSYGLLGDWADAGYWLDRTMRDFPDYRYRAYVPATVPGWQRRDAEALMAFRKGLDEEGVELRSLPVFLQAWYGASLARSGAHAAAIEVLEPLIGPDAPLTSVQGPEPQHDGPHALAWSYLRTGADGKAQALLERFWRLCRAELRENSGRNSQLLHLCAENALLRGEADRALDLLEQAVAAGWRDYYFRQHDPYWASLRQHPRYRALMAEVKADVDRQHAEVVRIDAAENFVAKLDAAQAARARADPDSTAHEP